MSTYFPSATSAWLLTPSIYDLDDRPTAPPVVRSSAELAAAAAAAPATLPSYTFYEAIADEEASPAGETEDEDPSMAEFNSMVSDYLKSTSLRCVEVHRA